MSDQHEEHERRGSLWQWVAFFVALPVLYVASWLATWWAWGQGLLSLHAQDALQGTIYRPVWWYMKADLPGGDAIYHWSAWLANLSGK